MGAVRSEICLQGFAELRWAGNFDNSPHTRACETMCKKCGAVGAGWCNIYLSISILYLFSIYFLFSFYKTLSGFYRVYPSFWLFVGLQKNGNRALKTRVFTISNVSY